MFEVLRYIILYLLHFDSSNILHILCYLIIKGGIRRQYLLFDTLLSCLSSIYVRLTTVLPNKVNIIPIMNGNDKENSNNELNKRKE